MLLLGVIVLPNVCTKTISVCVRVFILALFFSLTLIYCAASCSHFGRLVRFHFNCQEDILSCDSTASTCIKAQARKGQPRHDHNRDRNITTQKNIKRSAYKEIAAILYAGVWNYCTWITSVCLGAEWQLD